MTASLLSITSASLPPTTDIHAHPQEICRSTAQTAARVVNTQLIELYWGIGKAILDRQNAAGWGAKVIDQLAVDLSLAFPNSKGFSRRNLHYMRRLAEAWPGPAFVPQAVAQMPWAMLAIVRQSAILRETSYY